jgi:hypothetical protein
MLRSRGLPSLLFLLLKRANKGVYDAWGSFASFDTGEVGSSALAGLLEPAADLVGGFRFGGILHVLRKVHELFDFFPFQRSFQVRYCKYDEFEFGDPHRCK